MARIGLLVILSIGLMERGEQKGRVLCLDLGSKTIGLALSDPTRTIASPAGTLKRKGIKNDLSRLARIIEEREVRVVVLGLPLHLDGRESEGSARSRDFARVFTEELGIEPVLIDESLTTREAEEVLLLADVSRKKRKKVIDGMAASVMLQAYLNERDELDGKAEERGDD